MELTQWEIRAILTALAVAQNEGMGETFDPENIGELQAKLRALLKPE